jgi:Fur family ferric uptake transcriptional regulator
MTRRRKPNDETRSRETLKRSRLRVTRVRVSVLDTMRNADAPITHRELVRRLSRRGHDRATIFRTLVTLARAGLVRRIDVGDHVWRFSLVEATAEWVAHFVCTKCGQIELLAGLEVRVAMAREPRAITKREVDVHVHGRCDACTS